jgi:hypothetical protein
MSKITTSILKKIKKQKIQPRPYMYFIIKNIVLWTAIIVSILLGSLSVGIILHEIVGTGWGMMRHMMRGSFSTFALLLPYIWILSLVGTLFFATWVYRSTTKGYMYRPRYIIGIVIGISIVMGMFFYTTHASHSLENWIYKNVHSYTEWQNHREKRFLAPEQGVLIGRIIPSNDNIVRLRDPNERVWEIDTQKIQEYDFSVPFSKQIPLIIQGKKIGEHIFQAEEIHYIPRRKRLHMINKHHMQKNMKENEKNIRSNK